MLHNGLDYEAIPITFSGLLYLEDLTICAKIFFYHSNRNGMGPDEWCQDSPIPAITRLVDTALFLTYLTLDFDFHIYGSPRDLLIDWSSLVLLLAHSFSPSTTLKIRVDPGPFPDQDATSVTRTVILASLGRCVQVMRMVKQGVLVIIPEVLEPEMGTRQPGVSSQAADLIDASDGSGPLAYPSHNSGLKWWRKLLALATLSKSA